MKWWKEGKLEDHISRIMYAQLIGLLVFSIAVLAIYMAPVPIATFKVGGVVVNANATVTVRLNGDTASALTVTFDGVPPNGQAIAKVFQFRDTLLEEGSSYTVTAVADPTVPLTCFQSTGTVSYSNIALLRCQALQVFRVSGTVNGLNSGNSITIALSTSGLMPQPTDDRVTVSQSNPLIQFNRGAFQLRSYTVVAVAPQPTGQTCVCTSGCQISQPTGDITNVVVTCTNAPTAIPKMVSGFAPSPRRM
jgi:hypothetical protein